MTHDATLSLSAEAQAAVAVFCMKPIFCAGRNCADRQKTIDLVVTGSIVAPSTGSLPPHIIGCLRQSAASDRNGRRLNVAETLEESDSSSSDGGRLRSSIRVVWEYFCFPEAHSRISTHHSQQNNFLGSGKRNKNADWSAIRLNGHAKK